MSIKTRIMFAFELSFTQNLPQNLSISLINERTTPKFHKLGYTLTYEIMGETSIV
jgi:hypothetical protein